MPKTEFLVNVLLKSYAIWGNPVKEEVAELNFSIKGFRFSKGYIWLIINRLSLQVVAKGYNLLMSRLFWSCIIKSRHIFGKKIKYWYSFWNILEFSLSAYKRNKRKMEMAEKKEPEQNPFKRRRQSSGSVS